MKDDSLGMFYEERDGKPYCWLFGSVDTAPMQLFVEGSKYKSAVEAFLAYKREHSDFQGELKEYVDVYNADLGGLATCYQSFYARYDKEKQAYHICRNMDAKVFPDTSLSFDLLNSTLNFEIASEDYCVSNFEMAFDLYDSYQGLLFRVSFSDCDDYMDGRVVTLYGHVPTQEEIEFMMSFDPDAFPSREYFQRVGEDENE